MTITGFVAKSSYRDVDMFLSGTKWVDDIKKVKLGDLRAMTSEIDMNDWPMMTNQKYSWIKVTLIIEL